MFPYLISSHIPDKTKKPLRFEKGRKRTWLYKPIFFLGDIGMGYDLWTKILRFILTVLVILRVIRYTAPYACQPPGTNPNG